MVPAAWPRQPDRPRARGRHRGWAPSGTGPSRPAPNPSRRPSASDGRPPTPFIIQAEAAARLSSPRPRPSRRTTDGGDRTTSGSSGPGDPARGGPAAPDRRHPRQHPGRLGSSHLQHVRRRSDRGPRRPAPPLRLRPPQAPHQRPSDLLQGPCLAPPLCPLPGLRRDRRRGADDLPDTGLPAPGSPHPDHPVGGRGHRVTRTGAPDRSGGRSRRQVPRPSPLPGLGAVR